MALAEPPVDRKARAALIGGPALLALGLCLIDITGRSLGFDESATVAIAGQHGAALRHAIAHDGGNMSGYYVLMHVLVGWFGNGEVVLRLPSAIGSAIATGLTSALALRLFDRRVAFAAGVLMAVSLPMVFWGQSARSYAILVALTAASFLALDVAQKEGGRAAWGAYVITTALALYASLLAVLIIVAQLLVMDRRRLRTLVSALAAVAACSIPLIVLAARRGSGQLFWVPRPDWTAVKQVLQALTSSGLEPSIHTTSTTYVLLVLTVVMLIVAIVAARDSALLRSWLLTPVLFALVESFVGQPIFLPRNLLIVLPAVAILLASAVDPLAAGVGAARGRDRAARASARARLRRLARGLACSDRVSAQPRPGRRLRRLLPGRWPQRVSLLRARASKRSAACGPAASAVVERPRVHRGLRDALDTAHRLCPPVARLEPSGTARRPGRLAGQPGALRPIARAARGRIPPQRRKGLRLCRTSQRRALLYGLSVVLTNVSALSPASSTPLASAYQPNARRRR